MRTAPAYETESQCAKVVARRVAKSDSRVGRLGKSELLIGSSNRDLACRENCNCSHFMKRPPSMCVSAYIVVCIIQQKQIAFLMNWNRSCYLNRKLLFVDELLTTFLEFLMVFLRAHF